MENKCLNFIIYYDNYDEMLSYFDSLNKVAAGKVDVCVVINKDTENKVQQLTNKTYENIPNIKYVDYGENVGYLNAMIKSMADYIEEYKYYILSNTDIDYVSEDFFAKLLANDYDNSIGCIAPSVYSFLTDSYSNPHYFHRIPKRQMQRNIFIFKHPAIAKVYFWLAGKKEHVNDHTEQPSCQVYSPHGCYMIFTNEFAKYISQRPYGVKMYSEESYVGEMLLRANKKCFYDSSIKINHVESAITSNLGIEKKSRMFVESLQYIYDEFYR